MKKLFTLLGVALCALYAHATPVMVKPGLTLEHGNGVYYIHYDAPDYVIGTDTFIVESNCYDPSNELSLEDGVYYFNSVKLYDEGYFDFLSVNGRPELPFYSLNLLLSGNLTHVDIINIDSTTIALQYPYAPVQMQTEDTCIVSFDADYYSTYNDTWYWQDYSTSFIKYRLNEGVVFSFFPFHYEPSEQKLTIVNKIDFAIYYDGIAIDVDYLDNIIDDDISPSHYFDNFKDYLTIQTTINDNYLIVVGDHWESETALADFVAHKENLGYNVTVAALHEIGYTPDNIRDFIKMHFETYHTKFVLLVGDVDEIPFYDGEEEDTTDPPSDIYYACLSKNSISQQYLDFSPSVFLGRWPIQSSTQLRNVVDKTIASDLHLGESDPNEIAFFTGSGDYAGQFYNESCRQYNKLVIGNHNYTGDVLDGRNLQSSTGYALMKNYLEDLNDNPTWMFVYQGHGSSFGLSNPYGLSAANATYPINSIVTNTLDFQPFGFGFACLLGNIYSSTNFARTWITCEQGGVTFLGATTLSYLSCNKYFSRKLLYQLDEETKPNMTIGELVGNAKAKYYNCDQVVWRRRQAKKYVLYGDPSLYLFGIDINYNLPFGVKPRPYNPNVGEKLIDGLEDAQAIQIYSVTGQLMRTSDNKELNIQGLPPGIYMVVTQADDKIVTKKIIIQ